MASPEEMDISAEEANQELIRLLDAMKPDEKVAVTRLIGWWKKWFMSAGYKRLGRIIVNLRL